MIIRLEVQGGSLVSYATLLPFRTLPNVVMWGQRVFKRDRSWRRHLSFHPLYVEAFTAIVVDPTPRDKP